MNVGKDPYKDVTVCYDCSACMKERECVCSKS